MAVHKNTNLTYYSQPIDSLIEFFKTDQDQGLNSNELNERYKDSGFNELPKIKKSIWKIYLAPIFNFLIVILIITGISKKNKKVIKKAKVMSNLSKITERYSVLFLSETANKGNLEGTPIIQKSELEKMDDSEEILTLISERTTN